MSERLSNILWGLLVGVPIILLGAGLFLWDWYGEYIHFIWFIPFFILGPIIFIVGLLIVLGAFFPREESPKVTMPPKGSAEKVRQYPTSKIYYNESYGFSIHPPAGWEVVDSGLREGTPVTFWGPKDKVFAPNVFIAVMEATDTLEEYISMAKQQLSLILTNYQLVDEKSRVIDGLPAYELVYTYEKGVFHLKAMRVFLLKGEKVYTISFTVLRDNYDEYLPVFESSVETLKIEPGKGYERL